VPLAPVEQTPNQNQPGTVQPGSAQPGTNQSSAVPGQATSPSSTQPQITVQSSSETQTVPVTAPPSSAGSNGFTSDLFGSGLGIIKAIGAFILVIALLLICLKFIGWLGRGRRGMKGNRAFTLRGTMSLDTRCYLAAVEVDGHLLIVGVTPDRLTGLANWPLADDESEFAFGQELFTQEPQKTAKQIKAKAAPQKENSASKKLEKMPTKSPDLNVASQTEEGFTLTLDEDPFDGPQTNDDFINLNLEGDRDD
jgi:flagellar biogenesis protein FliO